MQMVDSLIFDLAPIAMWLEDFSEVQQQLEQWRAQGVHDLRGFLAEDPSRILMCAHKIKILQVNQQVLKLLEAKDLQHLQANLHLVFQSDMNDLHIHQLMTLWSGEHYFSSETVNYSLNSRRIDIQIRGFVLPGHEKDLAQVLVTTEDITPHKVAARLENESRQLAEAFFMCSPVALLMEDFSQIKIEIDQLKQQNIVDFERYLLRNPDFVNHCFEKMIISAVNQAALDLLHANSYQHLLDHVALITSHPKTYQTLCWQLNELWHGRIHHQQETVFYTIGGDIVHVVLQFTVFPGHEQHWDKLQISLTDISARKKAENHLQFLSQHDALTGLYNRTVYSHEVQRLEADCLPALSCIFIDMNGLKEVNDLYGHAFGDELLQRLGRILTELVKGTSIIASRIGGDEFVLLLPDTNALQLPRYIRELQQLLLDDNQHYPILISISIGFSTRHMGQSVQEMLKHADESMYLDKKRHYQALKNPISPLRL